jgi:predicted DNA binding CopG/RHH family protein|nr:MAG TPA: CopG-like protein [Caudoviricetes sp.]
MMDKVKNITIRVPAELKEKLKQEADSKGYPMKDLINFILWNYLKSTVRE